MLIGKAAAKLAPEVAHGVAEIRRERMSVAHNELNDLLMKSILFTSINLR